MKVESRAMWLLLLAAALFSTGGAAIKFTSLSSWQVAGYRSLIAALFLLLLPQARSSFSWRVIPVGLCYSATMILFVYANKLTTSANTIFLQSTAPLYLLLLSPFWLKEPINRKDLLTLAAMGSGLALFFVGTESPQVTAPQPQLGNLLAAISGLTWALTIAGLRWLGRQADGTEPALAATVMGNVITCVICAPLLWPLQGMALANIWTLLYLGIVQIGLAYVCMTAGMKHTTAMRAALLLLLEPVLNPIWSYWLHGEVIGQAAFTGCVVIVLATLFHFRRAVESRSST